MTTTSPRLAEETVDPAEARINADFVAFLKAVSARRHPTGPIRRFNQGRAAGCVRAQFTVLDTVAAGAPRRASSPRRAPTTRGSASPAPRRNRIVKRMCAECPCGYPAWLDENLTPGEIAPGFRAEQPSGDGRGEHEGLPGVVESDGRRRSAAGELLPVAPAIGGDRIPGTTTANQPSGYTVLEHDPVPVRSRPRSEVHRAPVRVAHSDAAAGTVDGHLSDRRLARAAAKGDACFDFRIQLQTDARTMPIEDATVEWKEADSPWHMVARIRIPQQDIGDGGDDAARV